MKAFRKAKVRTEVTVGESVKIMREFQELSQNGLAELTNIPQSTISAIENGRVRLGVERSIATPQCLYFLSGISSKSQPHKTNAAAIINPLVPFKFFKSCSRRYLGSV